MLSASIYSIYIGLGFRLIFLLRSVLVTHNELIKSCALLDGIKEILGDVENDDFYNH
jgi:hypothetical protein